MRTIQTNKQKSVAWKQLHFFINCQTHALLQTLLSDISKPEIIPHTTSFLMQCLPSRSLQEMTQATSLNAKQIVSTATKINCISHTFTHIYIYILFYKLCTFIMVRKDDTRQNHVRSLYILFFTYRIVVRTMALSQWQYTKFGTKFTVVIHMV